MDIARIALSRHACKAYDPTRKIPAEQIKQLITLLRYSPSSVLRQFAALALHRRFDRRRQTANRQGGTRQLRQQRGENPQRLARGRALRTHLAGRRASRHATGAGSQGWPFPDPRRQGDAEQGT